MAQFKKTSRAANLDGYANLYTGTGIAGFDPTLATRYVGERRLSPEELRAMYSSEGMATNIVDIGAEEITRKRFEIEQDTENLLSSHWESIGLWAARQELVRWDRLFGGDVGLLLANDGQKDLWRELRENSIQTFQGMIVFDRTRVNFTSADLNQDPSSERFGRPDKYTITPRGGRPFKVHQSRLVVLDGMPTPSDTRAENSGWGDSIIQRCYTALRRLASSLGATEEIIDGFIQEVLTINGLAEAVMNGEEEKIRQRLRLLAMSRRIANQIAIDKEGEGYSKSASSVAGLKELLEVFFASLSAVSRMPQTLLFGRSPAGLSATGESDQENWYNYVEGQQNGQLRVVDERLARLTMLAKQGPFKGQELPEWNITYPSLKQISEKEQAEIDERKAKAYVELIDGGVYHPNEVRMMNPLSVTLDKKFDDETTRPRKETSKTKEAV